MRPWENYWTAGYRIDGSSDVIVNSYCRTRDQAVKEGRAAAEGDLARLRDLGVGNKVEFWVQKWRTRQVDERDDREVVETHSPKRRRDPVYVRQMVEVDS